MPEPRASSLLLRNVPLFASFSEAQLEAIAKTMQRRQVRRGQSIINAGDFPRCLYLIVSGEAQSVLSDRDGNNIILAVLAAGDYFGEMELIEDVPVSTSIVAREACEILMLAKAQFNACLAENFEMSMTVLRGMARRLREADDRLGSLAMQGVDARLAKFLLQEAKWVDGARVVTSRFTKRDIGRIIGASRERVSRVMKQMQVRGLIEERGDSIVLRDQILTLA
jgi:CRP/FNR family cyclic AMP-dependent transcriptional regulator